jgi:hypothetical protein
MFLLHGELFSPFDIYNGSFCIDLYRHKCNEIVTLLIIEIWATLECLTAGSMKS